MLNRRLNDLHELVWASVGRVGRAPTKIADDIIAKLWPRTYAEARIEGADKALRTGLITEVTRIVRVSGDPTEQRDFEEIADDFKALAQALLDAVRAGNYGLAAAVVIVALVAFLRVYGARFWPPLGSRVAGPILAVAGSMAGAVLTALAAGQPVTMGLVLSALMVGLASVGLFSGVKNVVQGQRAAGLS